MLTSTINRIDTDIDIDIHVVTSLICCLVGYNANISITHNVSNYLSATFDAFV